MVKSKDNYARRDDISRKRVRHKAVPYLPLLANIALHGIEILLSSWVAEISAFSPGGHHISKQNRRKRLIFVKYADDFVVLHPDKEIVESAKILVEEFLSVMDLKIHEDRTRTAHTYLSTGNQGPGFKFLGFWIRNYSVGKTKRGKKRCGI